MNRLLVATVATPPGADGYGTVTVGDATRRCYFAPNRFATTAWPVPVAGDRALVTADATGGLSALWLLGQGTPTYTYTP